MSEYKVSIGKEDGVRNWLYSDFTATEYVCPKEVDTNVFEEVRKFDTMEDIASISYAARRYYSKDVKENLNKAELSKSQMNHIYLPLEGDALEQSGFYHKPTRLSMQAKTFINASANGTYQFCLRNSCYLKVWVNKNLVGIYAPKARNTEQEQNIELLFHEGTNEIEIYMEDLAERDVFFYAQFTYLGEQKLENYIPIPCSQQEIEEKKAVLKSIYSEHDKVSSEKLTLYYDQSLVHQPFEVIVRDGGLETICNILPENNCFHYNIPNIGIHELNLIVKCSDVTLTLHFIATRYDDEYKNIVPEKTIEKRKRQVLEFIAKEKLGFPTTMIALLEINQSLTKEAHSLLLDALSTIEDKKDCADFRLLPILVAYKKYGHLLPEELKNRIKKAVLEFRYWYDEPGNDVMWFYSENHALLFHSCRYLAGQIFPDEIFTVSNKTGKEQQSSGKQQILDWMKYYFENGYDEWNSITYLPIDLIALFSLHLVAEEEQILSIVKKVLDDTFRIIAGNMFHKKYYAAYARVYETYMKGDACNEMNLLSLIAFGEGRFNLSLQCAPLFCISDYVPADVSDILKPLNHRAIKVVRDQGWRHAHTYVYKTDYYSLTSAVNFKPFEPGIQQNVLGVAIGEDPSYCWINHPGELVFSGSRRPSYWAGNGTLPYVLQRENTAMAIYQIAPNHIVDFIHMCLPFREMTTVKKEKNWLFVEKDDAYLGIWFANSYTTTNEGMNNGKEVISYGRNNALIICCGSIDENQNFDHFVKLCMEKNPRFDGDKKLGFESLQGEQIEIDCSDTYLLNGKRVVLTENL